MAVYIGNQTACFTAEGETPFLFALDHGFTAFEWFDDKKHYDDGGESGWTFSDMSARRRQEVKALGEHTGMVFTVHAPWQANPLKEGGLEKILDSFDFASDVGATLVNIHLYAEKGAEEFVRVLQPALEKALATGVKLTLENTPHNSPQEFNDFFAALKTNSPDAAGMVGMCLDIGHANCCKATRNDYIRFMDELAYDVSIIHCHVHENWGDADRHLTLFTGPAKDNDSGLHIFARRLRDRHFSGALIMEQYPDPTSLLVDARDRMVAILHEEALKVAPLLKPVKASAVQGLSEVSFEGDSQTQITVEKAGQKEPEVSGELNARYVPQGYEKKFTPSVCENTTARYLVEQSIEKTSWRRRLEMVRDILLDDEFTAEEDQLAALAVYLRFIGAGELLCREDGGHYRPCHHAKAAQEIEERLDALQTDENYWLLRRIYPWLPSQDEQFQRREPLTRIRDIAHRNDIPKDLKQFIKHNLQNKLHRCAGPEDLQTSAEILARITEDGTDYSPAFVEQFKVFHEELKEFFNAGGLISRLENLSTACPSLSGAVGAFMQAYKSFDPLKKLSASATLREQILLQFAEADCTAKALLRICDISIEEYAFVCMGECAASVEKGEEILPAVFGALCSGMEHLQHSYFAADEAGVVMSEMQAWRQGFDNNDRFQLLRLRATLQRILRIADDYALLVREVLEPQVRQLGEAFNVEQHAREVFIEADIRSNVIFQISRVASRVMFLIREKLHLPPWDVIVPGTGCGTVCCGQSLDDTLAKVDKDQAVVALVRCLDGDEEIPRNVTALLSGRSLPHLSHLAVRARQAGVPLAACDTVEAFEALASLCSQQACVCLDEHGVNISHGKPVNSLGKSGEGVQSTTQIELIAPQLADGLSVLSAGDMSRERCGAKADGARMLADLAESSQGLFAAPLSAALPFGCFEYVLGLESDKQMEYRQAVSELEQVVDADLDKVLRRIRSIVSSLELPDTVVTDIVDIFGGDTLLAIRSSSSAEDLEDMAGAGLYDSIIGVQADEVASAILSVWASIWTKRAVLSRIQYNIPHDKVCMAILLQRMLQPDYSFVMHTADPSTGERGKAMLEIAPGLGETLVSAEQSAEPYRLVISADDAVSLFSCSSFSYGLYYQPESGVDEELLDYSQVSFSKDFHLLHKAAVSAARAGRLVENHLGKPQDIEGVFCGGKVYLVQSRPQALLRK